MSFTEWRERGAADARNDRPYNPPMHGPIMQAYSEGYDEERAS